VAVGVDAGGQHDGNARDAMVVAAADRERIDPHVRVRPGVQRPVAERGHLFVQGLGQLGGLGLAQPLHPEGLDQVLDPAGGHPGQVGLGHDRDQRPLGTPAGFQQPAGKVAAGAQPRDRQVDGANPGVPRPSPVAVADVDPIRAALAVASTTRGIGLGAHQRLGHALHQFAEQVTVSVLKLLAQPIQRVHGHRGHRVSPSRVPPRTT
jgi:hypothetical protein